MVLRLVRVGRARRAADVTLDERFDDPSHVVTCKNGPVVTPFKSNRAPTAAMPASESNTRVYSLSGVALKGSKRDGHADVINRFYDGVVTDSSVVGERR